MKPGVGPQLPEALRDSSDLSRLDWHTNVCNSLSYVYDAIRLTRYRLNGRVPLIGFSGAPWTLMTYMVEGGGSKTFSKSKRWLYQDAKGSHRLLELLTRVITEHLIEQAVAGAQILQVSRYFKA